MTKPFETHSQQLKILRKRNLITCQNCDKLDIKKDNKCSYCLIKKNNHNALRILEKENYYSLINGYNKMFLYRSSSEDEEEKYRHGSTICEIYELYLLDKKLRTILLQELLKYEHYLKTKCAYFFSKENKELNAYLNYNSFDGDSKDIVTIINKITETLSRENKTGSPIHHYIKTHDSIPLWVIINHFTFGNIRYFYDVCSKEVQMDILDSFNEEFKRQYPEIYKHFKLDECIIKLMNIITNFYRNTSAHNELMYDRRVKGFESALKSKKNENGTISPRNHLKEISKTFNIVDTTLNKGSFFTMIFYLKFFLTREDYHIFINRIEEEIDNTMKNIKTISKEKLLKEMGFIKHTEDWKNILLRDEI